MPEEKSKIVQVTSFTTDIVKQTNPEAASCVVDRLAGATLSIIKQAIKEGELSSAVVIFSTSSGRVTAVIVDEPLLEGCELKDTISYQADKMACQTMATIVASALGEKVMNATRGTVTTAQ